MQCEAPAKHIGKQNRHKKKKKKKLMDEQEKAIF
jgi:hypothetical protein